MKLFTFYHENYFHDRTFEEELLVFGGGDNPLIYNEVAENLLSMRND